MLDRRISMHRLAPLALLAAAALGLAACGGSDDADLVDPAEPVPSTTTAAPSTDASAAGAGELTISFWSDGAASGPPDATYVLACGATPAATFADEPPAFTVDPAAACAALAGDAGRAALAPVPAATACTEIYGGGQELHVDGTLDGATVSAQLSRANGCEIARWDALGALAGDAQIGVEPPPATSDAGATADGGAAGGAVLAAFVDADLELSYWADGKDAGEPVTYRLTCSAADGAAATEPTPAPLGVDPGVACAALSSSGDALAPVPADTICTTIYGGADILAVSGTLAGAPVDAELARGNGCEIARWDALGAALTGQAPASGGDVPVETDPSLAAQ